MSGKTTGLTPLELRKQLLVVESELNRVHLVTELQEVKAGVHHVAEQLKTLGSLVSSATEFGSKFTGIFSQLFGQHNQPGKADKKPSWFSMLFDGVRMGASLWSKLKTDRR